MSNRRGFPLLPILVSYLYIVVCLMTQSLRFHLSIWGPGRKVLLLMDLSDVDDSLRVGVKKEEDAKKWFVFVSGKIHLMPLESSSISTVTSYTITETKK